MTADFAITNVRISDSRGEISLVLALKDIEQKLASAGNVPTGEFADAVATLRGLCLDDLGRVDREIMDCLKSDVAMIPAVGGHLIGAGGKRLRPLLTLCAANMFGYQGRNHIRLAAAVELIHGATLLHDDVVDESKMRRGESTANTIWGNKESVLVGDFIFSRSFELMVATSDLQVLKILSHAAGVIAEGEVLQLATQNNIKSTFEMYLAVVKAKTAALFAAAGEVGAVISGASAKESQALRQYGEYLGIAFQLVDDALDYSGRQASLGKSVGDDFREGKMTLPVVYAFSQANDEERAFWTRTFNDRHQQADDLEKAIALVESTGALQATLARAQNFAEQAISALDIAPAGTQRDALIAIAKSSVQREY